VTINQKALKLTVEIRYDKQKRYILNLILILFKLRVGINHKEYPEYDIAHVLIIFRTHNSIV
jgi:hypothetical protein